MENWFAFISFYDILITKHQNRCERNETNDEEEKKRHNTHTHIETVRTGIASEKPLQQLKQYNLMLEQKKYCSWWNVFSNMCVKTKIMK